MELLGSNQSWAEGKQLRVGHQQCPVLSSWSDGRAAPSPQEVPSPASARVCAPAALPGVGVQFCCSWSKQPGGEGELGKERRGAQQDNELTECKCTSELELPHSHSPDTDCRVSEAPNNSGWEAALKVIQPNLPAMSSDIFNHIRLFRTPSNLTLDVSEGGASTTSSGTLTVKHFFLKSNLNLLSFSF